jgi:hypothetical protein
MSPSWFHTDPSSTVTEFHRFLKSNLEKSTFSVEITLVPKDSADRYVSSFNF